MLRSILRQGVAPWLGCGLALQLCSCIRFASELDTLDSERNGLDPASGQDWTCTLGARAPAPSSSGSEPAAEASAPEPRAARLHVDLSVVDFVTAAPAQGLRVRACFRADVDCASPVSDELPGSDGRVQVSADPGFNGYLEIEALGMLPTLLFFAAPWSSQVLARLEQAPVRLLPVPSLQALADTAHLQLDPAGGVVGVSAYDCAGAVASGVQLQLDPSAVPYAFVDELPVVNQDVTSEQGLAGFVNVPPGVVVVRSFAEGQTEAVSVKSLLVRSGWLSSVSLLPGTSR